MIFFTHSVLSRTVSYHSRKYTQFLCIVCQCLSQAITPVVSVSWTSRTFAGVIYLYTLWLYTAFMCQFLECWNILSDYWTYRLILITAQIGFPYTFYALVFSGSTCCNTFLWPVAKEETRTQLQKFSWAFKILSRSYIIWLWQQLSSSAGRSVRRLPKSRRVQNKVWLPSISFHVFVKLAAIADRDLKATQKVPVSTS